MDAHTSREAALMRHNTIDALGIRRRLGPERWMPPYEYGPAGWVFDAPGERGRVIVSDGPTPGDPRIWRHASISFRDHMPTYEDLRLLHLAVWPDGWSYQVFAPPVAHINISVHVLHLWGLPDGRMVLPNFGANGSI